MGGYILCCVLMNPDMISNPDGSITLKCDVQERLLNPASLSLQTSFVCIAAHCQEELDKSLVYFVWLIHFMIPLFQFVFIAYIQDQTYCKIWLKNTMHVELLLSANYHNLSSLMVYLICMRYIILFLYNLTYFDTLLIVDENTTRKQNLLAI